MQNLGGGGLGVSRVVYPKASTPHILGGYPFRSNPKPFQSLKFAVFSYKKGNHEQHFWQNKLILILYVSIHCGIDPIRPLRTYERPQSCTILTKILSRKKLSTSFLYLPFLRRLTFETFPYKFAEKFRILMTFVYKTRTAERVYTTWLQLRISFLIGANTINVRSFFQKKKTVKKNNKIKTSRFWDDITAVWRREKKCSVKTEWP